MKIFSTQAQKEYVIRTFYDLMQALRKHPDWLEELRNFILITEFFELPKNPVFTVANLTRLSRSLRPLEKKNSNP